MAVVSNDSERPAAAHSKIVSCFFALPFYFFMGMVSNDITYGKGQNGTIRDGRTYLYCGNELAIKNGTSLAHIHMGKSAQYMLDLVCLLVSTIYHDSSITNHEGH